MKPNAAEALLYRTLTAFGLALLLLNAGCRTAAPVAADSDAALQRRVTAQARFAAGIVRTLAEDTPAAMQEFYLAAQANPTDADLLLEVSGRLIEGRDFPKALEVLTWAAAGPQVDPILFVRLGFVYSQLGENQKSIAAHEMAVRRMPGYLPARHGLYLNFIQAKQPERALAVLDDAATQVDAAATYFINLAELYVNCGRQFPAFQERTRPKAIAMLDQAAKRQPMIAPFQLKLAESFYLLGETNKAAKWYLEILEAGAPGAPLRDILRAKLADIFLRSEDRTRATEQLTALVRDNPANAGAHYFLGAIAFEEKRWDDAIASYRRALLYDPHLDPAFADLATAQIAAGRPAEAVATLRLWRPNQPAHFVVEYLLGSAFHEQKKYAEAVVHFTAAEKIAQAGETNRLNTAFYFQLGATHERKGDRVAAAQYFEKSLALAPDNAEALNYLGYMWAEQGENLARARELIERALQLQPNNDAFLDSMGWVLFKQGEVGGALTYLLKAVAHLETPDATIYDHLGDVYAALNEMNKAREAWTTSVSIEANASVQKKLDALNLP